MSLPSSGASTTPRQKSLIRIVRMRGSRALCTDSRCRPLSARSSAMVSCWNFSIALRTPALTGFSRTSKLCQKLLAKASCGTDGTSGAADRGRRIG